MEESARRDRRAVLFGSVRDVGGTDPCVAQQNRVEVCYWEVFPAVTCVEMDFCDVVSWTPPSSLPDGDHFARVMNGVDIRDVASGIGTVTGHPWVLENSEWLALNGIDLVMFEVGPTATQRLCFGRVKALYR